MRCCCAQPSTAKKRGNTSYGLQQWTSQTTLNSSQSLKRGFMNASRNYCKFMIKRQQAYPASLPSTLAFADARGKNMCHQRHRYIETYALHIGRLGVFAKMLVPENRRCYVENQRQVRTRSIPIAPSSPSVGIEWSQWQDSKTRLHLGSGLREHCFYDPRSYSASWLIAAT